MPEEVYTSTAKQIKTTSFNLCQAQGVKVGWLK